MTHLPEGRAAAALLAGPALGYRAAVRLRNALFDAGLLKARRLPCPVVSIGNLTVGGTGKTPITSFIAGSLVDSGYRVAILSRGYRRRGGRAPLLVSDGRAILAEADDAGDEPALLARDHPSVAVAVGADRVRAARLLFEGAPPEVILLDDAYQHRRLARDLDLLLIDGADPWGNGRMLPLGPLREPLTAVSRADALVITRSDGSMPPGLARLLERHNPGAAIFHARIEPRGFVSADGEAVDRAALRGFSAYAFSGIARPERFEADLRSLGVRLAGARHYPDHHPYRRRDLDAVVRTARALGAEVLVTTEKDLVRIARGPGGSLPLYALALGVACRGGRDLPAFILERLRRLSTTPARRTAP